MEPDFGKFNDEDIKQLLGLVAKALVRGMDSKRRSAILRDIFLDSIIPNDEYELFVSLSEYYKKEEDFRLISLIAERIQATQALFLNDVSPELDKIRFLVQKYNVSNNFLQQQISNVFVLLPFQEPSFIVYEKAVKPVLSELGCTVEHADDVKTVDSIINIILTKIASARFLVADTSNRNPNVFYEIGYAHALGKKVILLSQSAQDLPFDVRHWRHIIYDPNSLNVLRQELREVASNLLSAKS